MPQTISHWQPFIEKYFQASGKPIYILGNFSKHSTLFSQQTRALNLVAGLHKLNKIGKGKHVLVVGNGAAGLTVAAACSHLESRVTVLERLPKRFGLMRNSRQRWLHPYIYDWPSPSYLDTRAYLPFFPWTADYAGNVVEQLEKHWSSLPQKQLDLVTEHVNVQKVQISTPGGKIKANFSNTSCEADMAILTIGFGLEKIVEPFRNSYWADDGLESYLRPAGDRPTRVLVSGSGDGALTDVMRLALMDFRHDRIISEFKDAQGFTQTGKTIQEWEAKNDPARRNPEARHKNFVNASGMAYQYRDSDKGSDQLINNELLGRLEKMIRRDRKITIACPEGWLFGQRASIFNRLIVSQLVRFPGLVTIHSGKVRSVDYRRNKFVVNFMEESSGKQDFDWVVRREGPEYRQKPEKLFEDLLSKEDVKRLQDAWNSLSIEDDSTRHRQWDFGVFPEPAKATKLTITKEIRENGSCLLRYDAEALASSSGPIDHLDFRYAVKTGSLSQPMIDVDSRGVQWKPEEKEIPQWRSELAGRFLFEPPIQPGDAPRRLCFSMEVENGHARTEWEADQMHAEDLDGERFQQSVNLPSERISLRLRLPPAISRNPNVKVFHGNAGAPGQYSLTWGIADGCAMDEESSAVAQQHLSTKSELNEFLIPKPRSCASYELKWHLDNPVQFRQFADDTAALRSKLVRYSSREIKPVAKKEVLVQFERLATSLKRILGAPSRVTEHFDVSFLTYDEKQRHMVLVQAFDNKLARPYAEQKFHAPYGMSVAGDAFKRGEMILFRGESDPSTARLYLPPRRDRPPHSYLFAIPLLWPGLRRTQYQLKPGESARYTVGVITVGSTSKESRIRALEHREEDARTRGRGTLAEQVRQQVDGLCVRFVDALLPVFSSHRSKSTITISRTR